MIDAIKQHAAARAAIEAQIALWDALAALRQHIPTTVTDNKLEGDVSCFAAGYSDIADIESEDIAAFICDIEEGN